MSSALSQAWQSWKGAKAVAILASLALAVGIGSGTAIYTVVSGVMLTPLPYAHADRLVGVYGATFSDPTRYASLSIDDLRQYEKETVSFDLLGWFRLGTFTLTAPGAPQHLEGAAVTRTLAQQLGVRPMLGQWFQDETSAVLSYALWTRLGADPAIVGKPVTLSGRQYTVTGVMPRGFEFPVSGPGVAPIQRDVWLPVEPFERERNAGAVYFSYARRKPGVSLAQAEADVKRVAVEIAKRDPAAHPTYTGRVEDLRTTVIEDVRPTLLLLFVAAGLLLSITCANVAGLLLGRSVARARETAIRVAMGASQRQLAVQYFAEGLLVSLAGAAAGVVMSVALVRVLVSIAAEYVPRAEAIAIDWRVLLFALGLACLASALSSLAPLWQAARTMPTDVLRDGVRASASVRSRGLSRGLVSAEIALAFTLLAISAVLIAHLQRLAHVAPGFEPDHLVAFKLTAPPRPSGQAVYQQQLIDAVAATPGVTSAAVVNHLAMDGCCWGAPLYPDGHGDRQQSTVRTSISQVSADYFRTMQQPLRSGRLLDAHDTSTEPLHVLINETAARAYWPSANPIGLTGRLAHPNGTRFQVVGIVGDVRNDGLGNPAVAEIYVSARVIPVNPIQFVVRSPLATEALVPALRRAVLSVDPTQPIYDVTTMTEIVQQSMTLERLGSLMTLFFAGAALLMATLGIYGVVAYSVRQGTVEIGTRMALGATPRDVLALVMGGGVAMALYGIGVGSLGVMASTGLVARTLGIQEMGWASFAPLFVSSAAIVAGVTLLASFFPAWRATRLSPMVAIRDQPGARLRPVTTVAAGSLPSIHD